MVLKINGTDITPYIASGGIKWTRYDIDAPKAGRTMDGTMQRGRVATKVKMEITCTPLPKDKLRELLNLILPEYVKVEYEDPMNGLRIGTFYSNNNPATYWLQRPDGSEWYTEITFPLVER